MALVLRPDPDSPSDRQVMHGEWRVGQIDQRPALMGTGSRWIWALNRAPSGPEGMPLSGAAGTLDEAEAELKKSWEQWLTWAGLVEGRATPPKTTAQHRAHADSGS
jgi:hypothetical protein